MLVRIIFSQDTRFRLIRHTPVIGDRERCLQAGMVSSIIYFLRSPDKGPFTGRPYYKCVDALARRPGFTHLRFFAEPLRRGDLLNAINKLAGERSAKQKHVNSRRAARAAIF
jgi:hypothetical protein